MALASAAILGILTVAVNLSAAGLDDDLLAAAKYGNRAMVERALKAGACVSVRDAKGRTPLMWASAGGYADIVHLLLEQGFNINAGIPGPATPLTLAASNGHVDVIRELLARRAALSGAPLRAAINGGHADAAALLARVEAFSQALVSSAKEGDVRRVRDLLKQGAAVNYSTSNTPEETPLAHASQSPLDAAVVRLLLENGADPWQRVAGGTSRDFIGNRLPPPAMELLTQAELAAPEEQLRAAVRSGETKKVAELLCRGADPDLFDNKSRSALVYAAENRDLIMVKLLLFRGAKSGIDTAMRIAGEAGRPDIQAALNQPRAAAINIDEVMKALRQAISSAASDKAQPRAVKAYSELHEFVEKWFGSAASRATRRGKGDLEYFGSLRSGTMELEQAIKKGNSADITQILGSLAQDIETKVEHCKKSGGLVMEVQLSVHTLRGSEEVRSWQVFYLSKIFEFFKDARPEVFPAFSSPAIEGLPPGRYFIWARDPKTRREGPRMEIKVGEGKRQMRVDVPVP